MISAHKVIAVLSPIFKQSLFKACVLLGCVLALTTNARAGFLYAFGNQNQIYGFSVNETTGALTLLAGFPISSGGTNFVSGVTEYMTIDSVNRRLYVINDGSDTVSAFSINPTTGALTALPFSPIALPPGTWATIAVHPSGSPLLVATAFSRVVASFNMTATTATAATGSPYSIATADAFSSVLSRDGYFYYTGGGNGGTNLAGLSINATTGVLTALAGSAFAIGGASPMGYAMDSQGRFFTAHFQTNQLRAFTTALGIPTAVTGNPFNAGLTQQLDGVLHPNEQFYFTSDPAGNRVGAYQIAGAGAATTLTPVAGSPVASSGTTTRTLVFNNSGTFLYAANAGSRNITTYSVTPSTGAVTFGNVQAANTLGTTGEVFGMAYMPNTFVVTNTNNTGAGSLRQAVTDASAGGGGLITFDPVLFATPQTISLSTGQLSISSNITIAGPGANLLTIRNTAAAGPTSRVFNITGGTVALSGMTITGSNLNFSPSGGAIVHANSILTMTGCNVSGNSSTNGIGGGIYSVNGKLIVNNSTISNNTCNGCTSGGGGIHYSGVALNITNSTISGNVLTNSSTLCGGGIKVNGFATITNSTITNNSTTGGTNSGSGVFVNEGVEALVRNSIIAGNNNATVPDVNDDGGDGLFISGGFNLIGNRGAVTAFNQTGDQTGTGAAVLNPLLAPLALNGGKTPSHVPLPASPAVDKGNRSNITTDQRGFRRQFDNLAIANTADGADIGAFERQANSLAFDFDGDRKTDIAVYRPGDTQTSPSVWHILQSSTNTYLGVQFGSGEDRIVPADFDGDGLTNIAVFRPSTGYWYTSLNPAINFGAVRWGQTGDIPVPGDFDGDGRADIAVFRPANATWYVLRSSDNSFFFEQFGSNGDRPLIADFDGDGRTDLAFLHDVGSNLVWNIRQSSNGTLVVHAFGLTTDKAVPADYDGDGVANIAVFRPTTGRWYTSLNPAINFGEVAWGTNGDRPVPADYDGDGKIDVTVFRPGSTFWFALMSSNAGVFSQQWGLATDTPVPAAFIP